MTTAVMQIAYATRDLEATARTLAAVDRVGPFYVAEFPLHDLVYRGAAVAYPPLRVAFGYRGDQQYELIEVPADAPSCYAEPLGGRREALHHIYQSSADGYDSAVARYAAAGEALVYHGAAGDDRIRFGFVDATARLGHFVELLETERMIGPAAEIYRLYDRVRQAAVDWDGQRPVRRIGELAVPSADS